MNRLGNLTTDHDTLGGTVDVRLHDLDRLLLMWRALVEGEPLEYSYPWKHMHDYDQSFERLADVVEAGRAALRGGKPDPRLRCKPGAPYEWPEARPHRQLQHSRPRPRGLFEAGGRGRDAVRRAVHHPRGRPGHCASAHMHGLPARGASGPRDERGQR